MSEQHENTERRLREALLAEGREAPAPPDLWARVAPRLERPAMPSTGWRGRWGLAAMAAAAAVVLAVGGTGTLLIAIGLSSGGGDGSIAALESDEALQSNGWQLVDISDEGSVAMADGDPELMMRSERGLSGPAGSEGAFSESMSMPVPTGTPMPMAPSDARSAPPAPQPAPGVERQIISRASLDIEVNDVSAATTQLRGLVESVGGFLEHVSTAGGPDPEYGSAVVRVPSDRFLDTLDRIERLGRAVGQSLGQQDVTGEVIDLEARLRSERSTEQSLLKLLNRASSVSDVLTVERELSRVRANIERMQGQLEFLQRSVALATISVSFMLPPDSTPSSPVASMHVEVSDVERSVNRIRDVVGEAGGTMGRVTISASRDSQQAYLSFRVPASVLDSVLTSLAGDGVVLYREVQSDGQLPQDGPQDGLQARVTVELQTPEPWDPWRSIGVPMAGAVLVLVSLAGIVALVVRARRRRA